ncbi:hypothetical protein COLO4_25137 [Corchorus olitorius]|uniref:Uncharacterized protein n=1 Tax=Corchorus olitorius TaxID=93759 RepID=A0A1R3I4G7_9ROSI|nr:hypothetical protein COLO4_25137 [Corchorus olitorius]
MSNNSSPTPTTTRPSSNGTNAAAAPAAAAAVTMSMRGPTATTTVAYQEQQQQQGPTTAAVMYPVASSGRGFLPTSHPYRPVLPYHRHHPFANSRPPPPPLAHPSHFHPPQKLLPSLHPKVAPSASLPSETHGYKYVRDRAKDDSLVNLRDRKVRITDGASIYTLCRSWLRNGFAEETQPQFGDVIKSLPHPLPIPITDNLPKQTEDVEKKEEENAEQDEQSVENLSAQDLLKRHIDRAKKVRSRLKEERKIRIARYKTRLALILPPPVEQFQSDAEAGN